MENLSDFRKRVKEQLSKIDPKTLSYNEDEFWLVRVPYEFLEYFAESNRLYNTMIALHLARGLHNGTYRKLPVVRNGEIYKQPYLIHCLSVSKMLSDMWFPFSDEEKDILIASALCHDMIEDVPFENGGKELYKVFGLDKRVYEIVKLVSKKKNPTEAEEEEYFSGIRNNRLALLVKLSDRGHNVSDLYNMKEWKIEEYIGETRKRYLPMCEYARENYPELTDVIEIMQDQIVVQTKTVQMLMEKHKKNVAKLNDELSLLREENAKLRQSFTTLKEAQ